MTQAILDIIAKFVARPASEHGRDGRSYDFVIDPFCGTGELVADVLLRRLAEAAVAADSDKTLVEKAGALARDKGVFTRAEFVT